MSELKSNSNLGQHTVGFLWFETFELCIRPFTVIRVLILWLFLWWTIRMNFKRQQCRNHGIFHVKTNYNCYTANLPCSKPVNDLELDLLCKGKSCKMIVKSTFLPENPDRNVMFVIFIAFLTISCFCQNLAYFQKGRKQNFLAATCLVTSLTPLGV